MAASATCGWLAGSPSTTYETFTDPCLCAAIVYRLTLGGTIAEIGTDSLPTRSPPPGREPRNPPRPTDRPGRYSTVKLGLEFTFDPEKFTDAAGDAADAVGDAAGDFKDWLLD